MERGELTGAILDGRYRVIEPVAEGAMGVVYRAERVKLGRIVAIKVLHDVLPGELSARKRFEIEARAMAKLEHPHCASVLDVGIHDGRPYVVMDFVSGQNLKDLVAEGPQPVGRAVELVRQVLSGLAHAHEHGIIHRDIKPANIVLSQKTGLGDHVKVLDFGLARLHDTGQNLTTGIVVGTPAYMAPEQIRGVVLDHRVDLYACGILLFELLTGVKPFHSEHDDPIEVCRMHLSAPIPRLDAKLRGEFGELEIIVARALAKDADDRYATAQAFVAALDAVAPRRPSMPPLALSAPSVPPGGYGSSVPAGPPVSSQAPVTTDGIQLASADVMSASDVSESSVLEVRSADVMSARSADSPQGEPALHRGGTVAGVVPARTATPVAGVPQRRTATPVAGVAQGRTATPVAGVAQGRTATPVAGVAVFAGEWAEPVSPPGTFLGIAVTPRAATAHRQASQMETEPSSATPGASPAMVRVPTSAGTPAAALGLPAPAQLPGAEPSPDAAPRSGRPSTSAGSSPAGPSERPSSPAGPSARPSSPAGPSERPSVSSFNGHLPDEVLVGATPGSAPGVAGGAPAGGVSVDRSAGAPGNATSTPAPAARWLARHTRV
ncbi:MAG TPA: protein kinase, partial [Kofleriaceae bacterium]|nr:protein kinase [Kofleriaceae bacterium]